AESTTLPIILYNNAPKTNVTIAPATAARLAEITNIVGIKDSTGDMTNATEYIRLTRDNPDFHVLMGRDTLIYGALCYGATGAIASCANVAPRIAADIYDKFVEGDLAGSLEAQYRFAPLRIACGMGTFPAVIKEGLVMQGIPVGKCLEPIAELSSEEKEKLRSVLGGMELL
ncbi:dihydrodipicolinate synthase family protein, partial [Lachnospiraceae bacterium OttesenSCG-928-J05]|nr:dihydrodipicolinate synthase family protein [Lachnospiraceae bacterium OttesenSCG-928-J05]